MIFRGVRTCERRLNESRRSTISGGLTILLRRCAAAALSLSSCGACLLLLVHVAEQLPLESFEPRRSAAGRSAGGGSFEHPAMLPARAANPSPPIYNMKYSGTSGMAVVQRHGSAVELREAWTGRKMGTIDVPGRIATTVSQSDDGSSIFVAFDDGSSGLWYPDDLSHPHRMWPGDGQQIIRAAFAPRGNWIVTATDCGEVRVWHRNGGRLAVRFEHSRAEQVSTLIFSADGKFMAVTTYIGSVRVWRVDSWQLLWELHHPRARSAAFSPDGRRLITGSTDRNLCVWNGIDGSLINTASTKSIPLSVAFAGDSQTFVFGDIYGKIHIREVDSLTEVAAWQLHAGAVSGLEFVSSGNQLVSASYDGTLCVWDWLSTTE